jgi:hypothetical protein
MMVASVPSDALEETPDRLVSALRRELVRQASVPRSDLIVTETAGRWNVSGPVDIDALAHVARTAE